jgi:hypothetical protein
VENNSKSGQDAADQKGTNKKDTKCDIKVQKVILEKQVTVEKLE